MNQKCVFLGLDGIGWSLIQECAHTGNMQHFNTLKSMSTQHGILNCLDPLVSPASWTSIATGTSPEEHWIFDFFNVDDNHSKYRTTAADKNPAIMGFWEFFDNPIVLHYPVTYPPDPSLRMASGMLTPRHDAGFSTSQFQQYFTHHFPGYDMTTSNAHLFRRFLPGNFYWWPLHNYPLKVKKTQEKFYTLEVQRLDQQMEVFRHFLRKEDFDLLAFVTASPDTAGHLLYNNKLLLTRYMSRLDEHIGKILEHVTDKIFLVCSDHGMHPFTRQIYMNQLFHIWGLQSCKRIKILLKKPSLKSSKAFFLGHGLVYLNTKEKFRDGVLDKGEAQDVENQIIEHLRELRDPIFDTPVITSIHKVTKRGGTKAVFPDLIIRSAEGYELTQMYNYFGSEGIDTSFDYRSATHHPAGIYAYYDGDSKALCTDIQATDIFSMLSPHFVKEELRDVDF